MKIIGYMFGILGLMALVMNAYWYLSGTGAHFLSAGSGLLLCIIGAVMIRGKKKDKLV